MSSKNIELIHWKSKYEAENASRDDELDGLKRKYEAKIDGLNCQLDAAISKNSSQEIVKGHLKSNIDDLKLKAEELNVYITNQDKKQKIIERLEAEWKNKHDSLTDDLKSLNRELKSSIIESAEYKNRLNESREMITALQVDAKKHVNEINEIKELLDSKQHEIHELNICIKGAVNEKEEFKQDILVAESKIDLLEGKISSMNLDIANVRQENERTVYEHSEETKNQK